MSTVLVTGVSGFIGMHLTERLISLGYNVVGLDSLNEYYDSELKNARLRRLECLPNFTFYRLDISDESKLNSIIDNVEFDLIVHLAAQAGVRYSITNPREYLNSNLIGFFNILEIARQRNVRHFVYASSSSVYGETSHAPFKESDPAIYPVSFYAATKRSNELMAISYSSVYGLRATGLRFFTVYGPWGRPDMAYYSFTRNILSNKPIEVFNQGSMLRDFTFVDDIIDGICAILPMPPNLGVDLNATPHVIHNIGGGSPVKLLDFISQLEKAIGKKASLEFKPMQTGDVLATYASTESLLQKTGISPRVGLEEGLKSFVTWYRAYHNDEKSQ